MGLNDVNPQLEGGTDGTMIGNISDSLKVTTGGATSVGYLSRTDASSLVVTSTSNSSTLESSGFGSLSLTVVVSAASGTNPTLDVLLQESDDGVTWITTQNSPRFSTTGSFNLTGSKLATRYYRYSYLVSGVTPSFTITSTVTLKSGMPKRTSSLLKYSDMDTTVVNNVSSTFNAFTCENITFQVSRPVDGKAAAKIRLQGSIDGVLFTDVSEDISVTSGLTVTQALSGRAYVFYRFIVISRVTDSLASSVYWRANGGT
jgi:hypothetical protein